MTHFLHEPLTLTEHITHLERHVTDCQTRNTELVEKIRDHERTIATLRRCEDSLRADLTSASIALKQSASRTYDSSTKLFEPNAAARWLDEHPD